MFSLPNILTLANLLSGCVGMALIFGEHHIYAVLCVGLSLLFDFLDGLSARLLGKVNPIGRELDSLADVVSFGALSGCMYYVMLSDQVWAGMPLGSVLPYAGFAFTVFGALRLARFNLDNRKADHFFGLPIPAAALFVTGLYWLHVAPDCAACTTIMLNPYSLLISLALISTLMVSNVPHFSLKVQRVGWAGQEVQWIYLGLVIVLFAVLGLAAIALAIVLYIFLSLVKFSFFPAKISSDHV